ncbi:hypothetical protein [Mahella australiensis]|uniref:hypothetical protein n=1 Tax=Mahella australiensis TaxID=252966 RepID=UPI000302B076|nr:hypothetical protein [Mahella australiensis]
MRYKTVNKNKNGWKDSCSNVYVEQYLYDLEVDPYEQHNLIGDLAYSQVCAVMNWLRY